MESGSGKDTVYKSLVQFIRIGEKEPKNKIPEDNRRSENNIFWRKSLKFCSFDFYYKYYFTILISMVFLVASLRFIMEEKYTLFNQDVDGRIILFIFIFLLSIFIINYIYNKTKYSFHNENRTQPCTQVDYQLEYKRATSTVYICCISILVWFSYYVLLYPIIQKASVFCFLFTYGLTTFIWVYFVNSKLLQISGLPNERFKQLKSLKKTSVRGLWYYYVYLGRCNFRILRVLNYTFLYSIFTSMVFMSFPMQANIIWSSYQDQELYTWILRGSIFCMSFLIFYVVDIVDQNNKWMQDFQDLLQGNFHKSDIATVASNYTKFIADRSKVISQIIFYPFIVVLLMLIARLSYFDNWSIPLPLLMVLGVNFSLLFYVGYRLRIKTEDLRYAIIVKLEEKLDRSNLNETKSSSQKTDTDMIAIRDHHNSHITSLVNDIRQINHGAFGSFWNQPLIRGAMVLIGALGITYSEYTTMVG